MPLTTYISGEVLTAASLNDNFTFAAANPTAPAVAIFNETQASGTEGGTFSSGSFVKRTLNTTQVNEITGCTLTISVIALPAGTYQITASTPALDCTNHKAILRNTTDSTNTLIGTSERSFSAGSTMTRSLVVGVFTITATKNFELQHRCTLTKNTTGLGLATAVGVDEVYSQIEITKIA